MGFGKYKYYFRKPRSAIIKDVLFWLAMSGAILIASQSPYFGLNLTRAFKKAQGSKKYKNKALHNAFYRLLKEDCIDLSRKNHQLYIALTEKGKEKANWYQIDSLEIKRSKDWDNKWRVVIFDISQPQLIKREAFRGKLRKLGFYQLQKSVWIHPFDCRDEIELLREFFGLGKKDIRLIVAESIEDSIALKKVFGLR